MSFRDAFRQSAGWERQAGPSEYAGMENLEPARAVPVRQFDKLTELGGDTVSNVTYWMLPQHQPSVGDRVGGARIEAVSSARDRSSSVLYWIAHGRQASMGPRL